MKSMSKANRRLEPTFAEEYTKKTLFPLAYIDLHTNKATPNVILNKKLRQVINEIL